MHHNQLELGLSLFTAVVAATLCLIRNQARDLDCEPAAVHPLSAGRPDERWAALFMKPRPIEVGDFIIPKVRASWPLMFGFDESRVQKGPCDAETFDEESPVEPVPGARDHLWGADVADAEWLLDQPVSFDTQRMRDVAHMFDQAPAFNQPLAIDAARVRDMWNRLQSGEPFEQIANNTSVECSSST